MAMQARMSQADQRLYSPTRDVAHNFDHVIMAVAKRLENGTLSYLATLCKEKGANDERVAEALQAVCRFVVANMAVKPESMKDGLTRSGFFEAHNMAQIAVLAHLGAVTLGIHWAGVREATIGGRGPLDTYADLVAYGTECHKLLSLSPWRRRLLRWQMRYKAVWAALTRRE